jgi:hypothetical protein
MFALDSQDIDRQITVIPESVTEVFKSSLEWWRAQGKWREESRELDELPFRASSGMQK